MSLVIVCSIGGAPSLEVCHKLVLLVLYSAVVLYLYACVSVRQVYYGQTLLASILVDGLGTFVYLYKYQAAFVVTVAQQKFYLV